MLRQTRLLVLSAFAMPAFVAVGCTIKSVDSGLPTETTSNVTATVGVGTTTSGTGGSGFGGSTSTTSATGGGTTTGTGGGTCVGDVGQGTPVDADCDTSAAALAAKECGPNMTDPTPDAAICHLGFKIYTQGAAEFLASCIANIPLGPSGNNCSDNDNDTSPDPVCIAQMYAAACPNPQADDTCTTIKTTCAADPFDDVKCKSDLAPYSMAGLQAVADCFNADNTDACQKAYDTCLDTVNTAP